MGGKKESEREREREEKRNENCMFSAYVFLESPQHFLHPPLHMDVCTHKYSHMHAYARLHLYIRATYIHIQLREAENAQSIPHERKAMGNEICIVGENFDDVA